MFLARPLTALLLAATLGASMEAPREAPVEAPPVQPVSLRSADGPSSVWRASGIVRTDGALTVLPGWSVRLGAHGRAHLLGPAPRVPTASGPWDDMADAHGATVMVRASARDGDAVYVEGRLRRGALTRSFLLRWDAASGAWTEASSRQTL